MKNKKLLITYYILLITLPVAVSAYELLAPLPGEGLADETVEVGFSDYLSWIFKFALLAAAFLAVIQITIGGVQYTIGGASESARSDAKKRIEQAIWGLLLALAAVLILYTINPDLVKNGFSIPDISFESGVIQDGGKFATSGEWVSKLADDSKTRNYLSSGCKTYSKDNPCILINKGPCSGSYYNTNCTMVSDMPQNTIDGVIAIKKGSKANITITGGTEVGIHGEHGPGKSAVDLRPNNELIVYMHDKIGLKPGEKFEYNKRYKSKDGKFTVIREPDGKEPGHLHVVFS